VQFSANLGFLWADRPLPDAIRAANAAGFDAVECHWPYDTPTAAVSAALGETGLAMLSVNTRRGAAEPRAAVDEAIAYAATIGADAVHVMAGRADDRDAHEMFVTNLAYAAGQAAVHDITILIEPLNSHDAPGYFLSTTDQACGIIAEVSASNLKMMFDCYHVGRTEGDVIARLRAVAPDVGHIQFASVPDRSTPDHGDVNYRDVFAEIERLGWNRPLGAEYRPGGDTNQSLEWMGQFR
jgi:hydroxypyruvate isomerase